MNSFKTARLRLLLLSSTWLLLLSGNDAFAQTKVTGTINVRTSALAQEATVTVKNTHRYTVANEEGRFTIEASANEVVVINMTGNVKKEVTIGKSNTVKVKLSVNSSQINVSQTSKG